MELHSLPLMDYLVDDIQKSLTGDDLKTLDKAGIQFPHPPELGLLDLEQVKESAYFFS